jgi:hypothetical protein
LMLKCDEMKVSPQVAKWVPVVLAACSLASIVALFQIDSLVNSTLYNYGLQFSTDWANPYWIAIRTAFVMTWIVAIASIGLQIYNALQKSDGKKMTEQNSMPEEKHWRTYNLGDGATIRVKLVLKSAKRLNKFSLDGLPMYSVATDNVVEVINVPEKLKAKPEQIADDE